MAADHAVARNPALLHPEVSAVVLDQGVDLLEAALVEEQLDPLARGQLALLVMTCDAVLTAAPTIRGEAFLELLGHPPAHAASPPPGTPGRADIRGIVSPPVQPSEPNLESAPAGRSPAADAKRRYHPCVVAADPSFDPRWLDGLAAACGARDRRPPRLEDLYLERRLEVRVSVAAGAARAEEIRTAGTAARWRFPSRVVNHSAAGTSPAVVARLLGRWGGSSVPAPDRAVPPPELDPPRGWREWALEVAGRLAGERRTVLFFQRQAAVVRPGEWTVVSTPPLVRAAFGGREGSGALLAVWGHPRLASWIAALDEPCPARRWAPEGGAVIPAVFTAGTAGVLVHELIGHLVEADLVAAATSPLAALAGATLCDAALDLVDDPTRADLPGAFSADDEGVTASPQPILDGGRLVGWLGDRTGAARLGCRPGRGRRPAWSRPPEPRLSNLVLAPGSTPPENLERDLRHGLVITRLAGATVDPSSGRAVLQVERGWEVRHGRRRRALAPCSLTGSVTEVLAAIDPALGDDPTPDWRLGWCVKHGSPLPTGSEAPTLLVRSLEVL